ncbi:MAG: hypothetical protein R2729_20945 [Bryobacteraceae bacterium]
MPYLDWLTEQIASRLHAGSIGQPVFLRANLELAADHGLILPTAAEAVEAAVTWLQSPVRTLYAAGGPRGGFISLALAFSGGQTAALGAELNANGEPSARLLIVGQHGILRLHHLPEPAELANPTIGAASRWIPMIERALATGRPVTAAEQ